MDEEIYFEESNPKRIFCTCLIILFVLGACFGAYYYYVVYNNVKLKNVTIELGEKLPTDLSFYLRGRNLRDYTLDIRNISIDEDGNVNSVGEYSYTVKNSSNTQKGKVFVKDTTPPIIELTELTVGLNEEFEPEDFVISCEDLSGICLISFDEEEKSYSENIGEHNIKLIIEDSYGNKITEKAKLIVQEEASLAQIKSSDLEIDSIYPIDKDWDKTYTVKFDKGLDEEDDSFEVIILELTNEDFSELYEDEIKNQTILTIYNKYNYVIGFSVKLEFEDGKTIYVEK